MTHHHSKLRDQLRPLIDAATQGSLTTGVDTFGHAVTITAAIAEVIAPYQITDQELVAYIRRIDVARSLSAEAMAASIAAYLVAAGRAPELTVFPEMAVVLDEASQPVVGQYGTGKTDSAGVFLMEKMLRGARWDTVLDVEASRSTGRPAYRIVTQQPDPALVAAMAGHSLNGLTEGETEALGRGISLATYRRLHPVVAGDLADQLAARVGYLATQLAARTDDDRIHTGLLHDPRSPGFRLAVHEARLVADKETTRRLALLLEWTLTSIALGRQQSAVEKLDRAEAIIA